MGGHKKNRSRERFGRTLKEQSQYQRQESSFDNRQETISKAGKMVGTLESLPEWINPDPGKRLYIAVQ